jgi:hypothetical protein
LPGRAFTAKHVHSFLVLAIVILLVRIIQEEGPCDGPGD